MLPPSEAGALSKFWHPGFHATPNLPEKVIAGREAEYIGWFHTHYAATPRSVPPAVTARAVAEQRRPGALGAGLAHYREAQKSTEQVKAALARGPLSIPVLAIGGSVLGELPEKSLRPAAANVRGVVLQGCGHWMPVECPTQLTTTLRGFFSGEVARR